MYQLMYENETVLTFDPKKPDEIQLQQKALLPVGMQNGMSLSLWLLQRTADKSRVSVRKLFATLKMNFGKDIYAHQFRKPTDPYWVKTEESQKFEAEIEDLHLLSLNLTSISPKKPVNFETTNIGSYEKGWHKNSLIKAGKKDELFSELFYASISQHYMPTAKYELYWIDDIPYMRTENFISLEQGEMLVLADEWSKTGAAEDFEGWMEKFSENLTAQEKESLKKMHFLDIVLNNFDRHCQNFGFIYRHQKKVAVAPNFDFNLSVVGYNSIQQLGINEYPVSAYFDVFDTLPHGMDVPDRNQLQASVIKLCYQLSLPLSEYGKVVDWTIKRWHQLLKMEKPHD